MENILAVELKRNFEQSPTPKYDRIYVSKRPFQVKSLKKKWYEMYGRPLKVDPTLIPPLQPEIDMILCKGKTMTAIELKYFRRRKEGKGLNHSFYEGIEQTLALLRWGFDHVALWQLFEYPAISKDELWFYGGWTWAFLHDIPKNGGLSLPIEFTFMLVQKKDGNHDFNPVQPVKINGSIRLDVLPPPYDHRFLIKTPHRNTLLNCTEIVKLRAMLVEWLETQKP